MKMQNDTNQEGITILPSNLQDGHVRFTQTTYVGDLSNDIVIEGNTDDVLRILEATKAKNITPKITLNVAQGVKVEDVVNSIKSALTNVAAE